MSAPTPVSVTATESASAPSRRHRQLLRSFVRYGPCILLLALFQIIPSYYSIISDGTHSNSLNHHANASFANRSSAGPINVTLTFKTNRHDRLGSRIQLPLSAFIVAKYHGWNFCAPFDLMVQKLSFPICDERILFQQTKYFGEYKYRDYHYDNINKSGVYYVNKEKNSLWLDIDNQERNTRLTSMLSNETMSEWRNMILNATLSRPEHNEELWIHPNSIRIAVHARRGDILPGVRNDVWVSDEQIISLIEMTKFYVQTKQHQQEQKIIEVHLFSENYGATNWTKYGNLVDKYHLAPTGNGDVELNLRDWKHFVKADVLIAGGTFSFVPGLARHKSNITGLPLTITRARMGIGKITDVRVRGFTPWFSKGWNQIAITFPDIGTVAAKFDDTIDGSGADDVPNESAPQEEDIYNTTTIPYNRDKILSSLTVNDMFEGLCQKCRESSVPRSYYCGERIKNWQQNGSYENFVQIQRRVSQNVNCVACNPDTCRIRIVKTGPRLPIESVIGARYEKTCPLWKSTCLRHEYAYVE